MTYSQLIVASKYLSTCHQCLGGEGWCMLLARFLSPLNSKLSPVGRGYGWTGDNMGVT